MAELPKPLPPIVTVNLIVPQEFCCFLVLFVLGVLSFRIQSLCQDC